MGHSARVLFENRAYLQSGKGHVASEQRAGNSVSDKILVPDEIVSAKVTPPSIWNPSWGTRHFLLRSQPVGDRVCQAHLIKVLNVSPWVMYIALQKTRSAMLVPLSKHAFSTSRHRLAPATEKAPDNANVPRALWRSQHQPNEPSSLFSGHSRYSSKRPKCRALSE